MLLARSISFFSSVGLALGLSGAGQAVAQQAAGITGRVIDQSSQQPVQEARVVLLGTSLVTSTDAEGRYTLRGMNPGSYEVRALRIGFAESKRPVTVAPGQTATLDFTMSPVAIALSEVVTTATGEQRRLEVGNKIGQIDAAEIVATRPIANITDLLVAREPGVQVLPGNMTGTGARVRIRGTSSVSLGNAPIYVIDGIRMTSATGSSSIGVGGSNPSRVNDLNAEEIESIEIVKGPSAATLYGTDAANGVIVITTKKGRAGRARWTAYVEQGLIQDRNEYFDAYTNFGRNPATGLSRTCILSTIAAGTCRSDRLATFNLFEDPQTTPLGDGHRGQYGLQVSGGSEAVKYFVSGELEDEVGVLKTPDFEVLRLDSAGVLIRPEQLRPNALRRISARANLNFSVSSNAEVAVTSNYISSTQRLPQTDNNTTGLLSSAYGGPGERTNRTSGGAPLYGYRAFTPGDIFQETVAQDINRFIGGVSGNWRPNSWLSTRGNFGLDFTNRVDTDVCRRGNCSDFGTSRQGFKVDNRTNFFVYTVDVASTASIQPTSFLSSKTAVGAQYFYNLFEANFASGANLPPGTTSLSAGAIPGSGESTTLSKTVGAFIEQNFGFRDRLFVTGALRADDNSAFGQEFSAAYYPKAAVSWIVSEEPFFPRSGFLGQLRVRAAYGASGTQPGTTSALRFFAGTTSNVEFVDRPGIVFSALGNPDLKPERSTELEVGFDSKLFNDKVSFDVTYYNKRTRDALISRVLPPSLGAAASRFENLGAVRNSGWEGLINAQLLETRNVGFDFSISGSANTNKLLELGRDIPPIIGATIRQIEGFPLNGYWERQIKSVRDANGDNIITIDEIVVGDSAEFIGYSTPRYEAVFNAGLDLLNRRLRVTSLFDYKGGHKLYNNTERIRCGSRNNCRGLNDPSAPLFEQARVVALRDHPSRTLAGFFDDADFVRFRELAVTLSTPDSWARRIVRAQALSITASARNLATWTDYTGLDPEANYSTDDVQTDFQTTPPPTYFTLRLNITF